MASSERSSSYALGGNVGADELMRRRKAAKEASFLVPFLKQGMSLVDVGCGQGTITLGLAEALAPGHVLGFDLQEEHVRHARTQAAERGLSNLTFEVGDLYDNEFPSGQFDCAYANLIISHLREPATAIAAIVRLVKPGGVIGLRDRGGRFLSVGRNGDALDRIHELIEAVIDAASGNPYRTEYMGLVLGQLCREAGLEVLEVSADWDVMPGRTAAQLISRIIAGGMGKRIADLGLATTDELDALLQAIGKWADDPDAFHAVPHFSVVARLPSS